ncbi:VOC family protein [Methylobacterium sp. 77]|uniref:VOC family protein n=1 Tax=Methylobacterium sp. 77 TaxID=1101192 RepID=UPI0003A1F0DD|nr:VOC family protein [Methylobacterium sp. 77]
MTQTGRFIWYELMTTDLAAAREFYSHVTGWSIADSGMPGIEYSLASSGAAPVGGMMTLPDEVRAMGARPSWMGYIAVADVDAASAQVREGGGTIHRAPDDIPGIGRFCVAADPQGAVFVLFRGDGTPPPAPTPGTPGHFGWHELHARDWEAAFAFYASLFGWVKTDAVDMGPMGTYQLFGVTGPDGGCDGVHTGGMMTNTQVPAPFWLYYVNVGDIDAAGPRVTARGGQIIAGPHQVPGGAWILHALDPQGAMFALVGPRPNA